MIMSMMGPNTAAVSFTSLYVWMKSSPQHQVTVQQSPMNPPLKKVFINEGRVKVWEIQEGQTKNGQEYKTSGVELSAAAIAKQSFTVN